VSSAVRATRSTGLEIFVQAPDAAAALLADTDQPAPR
jgi:hypothetical protein